MAIVVSGLYTSLLLPPQQGKETQLLHVFEEDLILGNQKKDDSSQDVPSVENGRVPFKKSISSL